MERERRELPPVLVAFCALLALGAQSQEKRTARPEDFVDIRWISGVQVSTDGKRVAFVVTEPADPKKPKKPRDSNIWMVPVDGSEPSRLFAASPKSETIPRWSPDGRYLAFLSNRGEPLIEEEAEGPEGQQAKNQIYLLRADGGEAEALTAAEGGVEIFRWSPDSRMIAFTARDARSEEERKKRKEGDDAVLAGRDYKHARLWVVGLADRKPVEVTKQELNIGDLAWSADGSELALMAAPTPRLDDVYWNSRLIVVRRLTAGVVRTLSETVNGNSDPDQSLQSGGGRSGGDQPFQL